MLFTLPADHMALLAEEVCGCKAELLSGGIRGDNAAAIITHLWGRQPVLIPYPTATRAAVMGNTRLRFADSSFSHNSLTVRSDMTRITTTSRVGGAATGRTGPSLQVTDRRGVS